MHWGFKRMTYGGFNQSIKGCLVLDCIDWELNYCIVRIDARLSARASAENFPGGRTNGKKTEKLVASSRGANGKKTEKQQKIVFFSLSLLYLYHVWGGGGGTAPLATRCRCQCLSGDVSICASKKILRLICYVFADL